MRELAWLIAMRVAAGVAVFALGSALFFGLGPLDGFFSAEHVPYRGLEWLVPLPPAGMRVLAAAFALSGVGVAIGFHYRASAVLATSAFGYLFFVDSLYYDNVVYFGLLLLMLLAVSPAHAAFSIDARRGVKVFGDARMFSWLFRFQVGCVYFYSGLSKLEADWLSGRTFRAMCPHYPPARWLAGLASEQAVYAGAARLGAAFDLLIVPLLLVRRTRGVAFVGLVAFHVHNAFMLDVRSVPWIMALSATVFLPRDWPLRLVPARWAERLVPSLRPTAMRRTWLALASVWVVVQIAVPIRRVVASGNPYFSEHGFRFSWALRSRAKTAGSELIVVDRATGARERKRVAPSHPPFLAARAEGDPHAIWWAAQNLARNRNVSVRADAWATVNGSSASHLIDPRVDLTRVAFPLLALPRWVEPAP